MKCKKIYTLNCDFCQKEFSCSSHRWKTARYLKRKRGSNCFCSPECRLNKKGFSKQPKINCLLCGKERVKSNSDFKRTKNHFCSNFCAAKYNNAHKTHGTRRSKLEVWLEEQLPKQFPDLVFLFNRKDAINSELDIFIPELKLAFELNGIFHYEPIYGEEKLCQIQNNDQRKFQACLEKGIELCIIDSSKQRYFKPKTAQKYLDIIINVINQKVVPCPEVESGYPCGNTENFKFSGDTKLA